MHERFTRVVSFEGDERSNISILWVCAPSQTLHQRGTCLITLPCARRCLAVEWVGAIKIEVCKRQVGMAFSPLSRSMDQKTLRLFLVYLAFFVHHAGSTVLIVSQAPEASDAVGSLFIRYEDTGFSSSQWVFGLQRTSTLSAKSTV